MTGCSSTAGVDAVLVGAADPPGRRTRRARRARRARGRGGTVRRPELAVVLAGGMADQRDRIRTTRPAGAARSCSGPRGGSELRDGPLARLLLELRPARPTIPRRSLGRGALALAEVLDRRIEIVEIGYDGGQPGRRLAGGRQRQPRCRTSRSCRARRSRPADPDDAVVERVLAGRRGAPTGIACATACASCASPRGPTPAATGSGCAWPPRTRPSPGWPTARPAGPTTPRPTSSSRPAAPGRSRRRRSSRSPSSTSCAGPGRQFALDHARLLGPARAPSRTRYERRAMIADLADDLLAPLGTRRDPGRAAAGRSAGRLVVHGADGRRDLDLDARRPRVVDLPPGSVGGRGVPLPGHGPPRRPRPPLRDRRLRRPGRSAVDLRDVPLRLPERADRRGELLASWRASVWDGTETMNGAAPTVGIRNAHLRLVPARRLVTCPGRRGLRPVPGRRAPRDAGRLGRDRGAASPSGSATRDSTRSTPA